MKSEEEREELKRNNKKGRIGRRKKTKPWQNMGLNQRKGEQEMRVGS